MSITTPEAITMVTVFGYVYNNNVAVENATVRFTADAYLELDNHIKIDETVLTDSEGRYQVDLPRTEDAGQVIQVKITFNDNSNTKIERQFGILTGDTSPISVQEALAEPIGDAVITGGPQGPPGPQGPQGPQGQPGDSESTEVRTPAGTSDSVTSPQIYYYDLSSAGGNVTVTIPDADSSTEDSRYRFYKIDSGSNTLTIRTVSLQNIGGSSTQEIVAQDSGLTIVDQSTLYRFIQDSRFEAVRTKTLYESNSDTNAFTDAEQTKLAGIEAGAEVNEAIASQSEAETGTDNTNTMTALRTRQSIDFVSGYNAVGGINSVGANTTKTASWGHTAAMSGWVAAFDGEIVAVSIGVDSTRTAGTCTAAARINGVAQNGAGETAVIDGTNTDSAFAVYPTPVSFSAGDVLTMETVTVGFAPTGSDATVSIFWRRT